MMFLAVETYAMTYLYNFKVPQAFQVAEPPAAGACVHMHKYGNLFSLTLWEVHRTIMLKLIVFLDLTWH